MLLFADKHLKQRTKCPFTSIIECPVAENIIPRIGGLPVPKTMRASVGGGFSRVPVAIGDDLIV